MIPLNLDLAYNVVRCDLDVRMIIMRFNYNKLINILPNMYNYDELCIVDSMWIQV